MTVDPAAREQVPKGLRWCSDDMPGLKRARSGRGFTYRDADGETVRDRTVIARIRTLAIPPAWTDVWICSRANGHIQATGRDARGRKQYRYHPDWTAHAAADKFARLPDFARALPRLQRRIDEDLALRGPVRDKVLATAVRLLELTLIRVGNAEYARQNRSYGLTTLSKRHLAIDGTALKFSFKGKSGVEHAVSLRDRRLASVLRGLQDLPGQHLFKYRDANGELCAIGSDEVNAYIRDAMGEGFSAKDFRTWAGGLEAARILRGEAPATSPTDGRRKITACMRSVAGLLGNTPSVCRSSYVHPRIIGWFETGEIAEHLPGPDTAGFEKALIRALAASD